MPLTVTCPSCHRTFRVGDQFAGRRGLCPDCGAVVTVPDLAPPQLDPWPDEPTPEPRRRRRESPRRPTSRDHLPAWRRVSVGFLIQQVAAVLLLIGLILAVAGVLLLADDPGDLKAEPNEAQGLAALLGFLVLSLGFVVQMIGRMLSAAAPAGPPRVLGTLSAVAGVVQFLGFCLSGLLLGVAEVQAQQGNPADPALETLGGLCLFGWMFVVVGGESLHGFAVGAVGRALRADGARVLGTGLGLFAAFMGLAAVFVFCGLAAWVGNNNPQNPEPDAEQSRALLAWLVGVGLLCATYWGLDLILLQLGRSAVARNVGEADRSGPADRWD